MRLDDINIGDFTVVQVLHRDPCPVTDTHPAGWTHRSSSYVADSPFKSKVKPVAEAMRDRGDLGENVHEIHYYPRTYKDIARSNYYAGKIIKMERDA